MDWKDRLKALVLETRRTLSAEDIKHYRRELRNTNRQKSTNKFSRSSDLKPGVIGVKPKPRKP